MGFYVNPPADAFKAILRSKTYIDKSGLIAYTNQVLETSRMLTCFSRPRRFGKSFAAKMLATYYSRGADSRELFEDLEISNHRFGDYWTKTETYESLKTYIDMNYDGLKDAIVDLLGEKRCRIDTGTFQNDMTSLSGKDDIFTLLVHLGYLAYDMETEEVFIPNEEVRNEFIRAIRKATLYKSIVI